MKGRRAETVVVVGAGIAGLSAAIALHRAGCSVVVCEQAEELAPMGAALSLWGNAMGALDELGVGDEVRSRSQRIETMAVLGRDGRPILGPFDLARASVDLMDAYLPIRSVLQSALLKHLPPDVLRLGCEIEAVEQCQDEVVVRGRSGETWRADLVVVANGIWSPEATSLSGGAAAHAGYGGVLALSDPVDDPNGTGAAREYWGDGERFGLLDIGENRRYWFYMRDETVPDEAQRLSRDTVVKAAAQWPVEIARTIDATPADRLIPFSIHAKPVPKGFGRGRVICVGDAAHAMEPNLGQGGCQGIEDGVALGALVSQHPADAVLQAFELLRLRRVATVVKRSRAGARAAHSRSAIERRATRAVLRTMPKAVSKKVITSLHTLPAEYRTGLTQ